MESIVADLKLGFRTLIKRPAFSAVAVVALALGIGANTAIFSVVNSVLLRPLPYDKPERLVAAFDSFPEFPRDGLSELEYMTLRGEDKSLAEIAIGNGVNFTLTGAGDSERVQGAVVSSNYFELLGISVALGRGFALDEDLAGKNNVVILSDAFWKRRFGADPRAVGQPVTLSGTNFTIAGVLPSGFKSPIELQFAASADVWVGYGFNPGNLNRGSHGLVTIARLRDGVTLEQAQDETKAIIGRVLAENPTFYPTDGSFSSYLTPLHTAIVGDVRTALLVLLGAVATVLLIACANVANLSLARSEARQKEIAVRTALGASRSQIVRQLLVESLVLAAAGGAAGLLLARWILDALVAINPGNIPRIEEMGLDLRVLLFTLLVSLFTGVLFGLAPALQAARTDLISTLKEGGRTSNAQSRGWVRKSLVVTQTALALVLLIGAGLLLRSFWGLQRVPTGFNPEHLLTMRLSPPATRYGSNQQVASLYEGLTTRLQSLPGVQSVAVSDRVPIGGGNSDTIIQIEGHPFELEIARYNTDFRVVSPEYFQTMDQRLISGRYFVEFDREGSPNVTVVNETLAHRQWPDENPIGKRLRLLDAPPERASSQYMTIVGVVADAKNRTLTGDTRQDVYVPLRQQTVSMGRLGQSVSMGLLIRTTGNPASLTNAIREEVRAADPDIPITQVRTMEQIIGTAIVRPRFNLILLATFAVVALGLGAIGIYSVIAYSVAQRTHEIGVRMALGAQPRDVLKMVLGQGMRLALAGAGIGLVGAFALTRVMQSLLFQVSPTDPLTFLGVAGLLMLVAILACYVPARRATKVDPMIALRYE